MGLGAKFSTNGRVDQRAKQNQERQRYMKRKLSLFCVYFRVSFTSRLYRFRILSYSSLAISISLQREASYYSAAFLASFSCSFLVYISEKECLFLMASLVAECVEVCRIGRGCDSVFFLLACLSSSAFLAFSMSLTVSASLSERNCLLASIFCNFCMYSCRLCASFESCNSLFRVCLRRISPSVTLNTPGITFFLGSSTPMLSCRSFSCPICWSLKREWDWLKEVVGVRLSESLRVRKVSASLLSFCDLRNASS